MIEQKNDEMYFLLSMIYGLVYLQFQFISFIFIFKPFPLTIVHKPFDSKSLKDDFHN